MDALDSSMVGLVLIHKAIELHFGLSFYKNHQAKSFNSDKRVQLLITDNNLRNWEIKWWDYPKDSIINYFISRLKHEIINEMDFQMSNSISQVIGHAQLIESKLKHDKNRF